MRLSGGFRPAGAGRPPAQASPATGGLRGVVDRSLLAARQWTQLTPRHHLQAVRRYRWLVLTLGLLGAVGGGLASLLQAPVYKANVQLFFSPNFPTSDIRQLDTGGNYILQRVRSYTEIANNPEVAGAVIARLGLPYSREELMSRISVTGKASTAVLTIEVGDAAPERARDIANAIADEFPGFIGRLEKPTGVERPPVKVTVVRPATTPPAPESPRPLTDVGLGLAGGLFVGTATAITRYARDRTVRDEQHAAEVAELALVGVAEAGAHPSALIRGDEQSARAEAFRQLRTDLRLRAVGERLTSVAVIGCTADDGRTVTAANLAIAFARAGETVVLIDGDVRHPEVHELFNVPNEAGLAAVMRGEASVNDVVLQWQPELPLYLLPSGRVGPGPVERVLRPDRLATVMESFRLGQVLVVVNAPPLLSDAEAMFLVTATDATVVVARTGLTRADQLAAAVGVLRKMRANLLGLIAVRAT